MSATTSMYSAPPNPRKRASVACNGCRVKRTKCDGSQPRCSACYDRKQDCEYTQAESNRKRHTNAYINALEARVASLEKQLALRHSDAGSPDSAKNSSNCDNDEAASVTTSQASTVLDQPTNEDEMDDLANALGCFTLGEIGELHYFGASSNFSLIQNHSIKVPSSIQARNKGIEAANQMPDFVTPSDELRDHLLEIYWRWQNSWQFIVPRELFVRDLYVDKSGRYCTPLLMAAILAMASRYSPRLELRTDPDDANTAGEAFAAQAKTMLHYECEAPTTSTVQATALLGLYLATCDSEGIGFMYIGMATRMAMNLGLHCDCSPYAAKGLVSDEDVEARNVTFWGVYFIDKLFCLGMGRPASIQEYNITTTRPKGLVQNSPLLTDYQLQISTPFPTTHVMENSMYTCELMLATSEVIDQLYAQRYAWTDKEREDRVMKAHLQAVGLFDRLPKSLKISSSSLQCSPPYVYQFHLQYHHAILLLHRPFFQLLNPGKSSIPYDPEGGDIHSKSSRESAVKMARILQIFKKNYTMRNVPVSAVHPAFTAAIIHLLHIKTTGNSGRTEAMRCLYVCIKSLYEMNVNWNWANRSIRAILSLATEWEIDIWAHGLGQEISEESRKQFERYEMDDLVVLHDQNSDSSFEHVYSLDQIFESWTYDQCFGESALDFFV
ncbi:pathway-specific regulatory nit-4 [Fusarium beomiforme]|uniref:Pathway-specific regulatory nit-4 n=1 Tax=Fusarium beomiforme TaxID=44412 RepID=A0A9P5AKD3_9HYPO|nr:pathway-specific regulatory nit-4 [Fusarium beomiforme]